MMATNIALTDLTNGALDVNNEWSGTGVFDVLMKAVNENIEGQYNKTRITGTDYATVYLGAMQSVIAQSMQYLLTEKKAEAEIDLLQTQDSEIKLNGIKDRAVKEEQALNEADKRLSTAKAREVQEAQRRLYERQILGFDDNKEIKAFESQLNSWALLHSSGMIDAVTIPTVLSDANLESTYNSLISDTDETQL